MRLLLYLSCANEILPYDEYGNYLKSHLNWHNEFVREPINGQTWPGFPKCKRLVRCNSHSINTLRPRKNGRHFADDILKCIFFNANLWTSNTLSLKYVPYGLFGDMSALVQIIAWCRTSNKPLSDLMMITDAYVSPDISELLWSHCERRRQGGETSSHWGPSKMVDILQTTFSMHFLEWKPSNFR